MASSGVMHGYTCRRNVEERHKSIVRLAGADDSLKNLVHHFTLKEGYVGRRLRSWEAVVNHYEYQAWVEFRNKFRQRVSAYVSDWTEATNPNTKDRTPGLGFEPIEPENWTRRFCYVNDTRLRDVSWRWFHRVRPDGFITMACCHKLFYTTVTRSSDCVENYRQPVNIESWPVINIK